MVINKRKVDTGTGKDSEVINEQREYKKTAKNSITHKLMTARAQGFNERVVRSLSHWSTQ
jgi:hypothetical protein